MSRNSNEARVLNSDMTGTETHGARVVDTTSCLLGLDFRGLALQDLRVWPFRILGGEGSRVRGVVAILPSKTWLIVRIVAVIFPAALGFSHCVVVGFLLSSLS